MVGTLSVGTLTEAHKIDCEQIKSIDLGTEALVPNQAAAELPRNMRMIAYLWGKLEPSLELHSAKAHGQSMTMPSDNGQPSA